jgi:hypothetical protein
MAAVLFGADRRLVTMPFRSSASMPEIPFGIPFPGRAVSRPAGRGRERKSLAALACSAAVDLEFPE